MLRLTGLFLFFVKIVRVAKCGQHANNSLKKDSLK
jgi:hypothetical protein